jgi:hypothetical protein
VRVKIFILIFILTGFAFGAELKFVEKVNISTGDIILQRPTYFCVTEDNIIFLTDSKAGDIKIFDDKGKLLKVWGKKGPGPGEFFMPFGCTYDKKKLVIMDFMKKKFFVFNRSGQADLELTNETTSLELGYSICLKGNKLLVAGYKEDKNERPYDLYIRNLTDDTYTFLLPSEMKFGFDSVQEYRNELRNKFDIRIIGLTNFCDWGGNHVYSVWEGDLKIFKINLITEKIKHFGEKTSQYIKPSVSKTMIEAHKTRNIGLLKEERGKMSFVRGIFAGRNYVGLLYDTPAKETASQKVMLQIYDIEGKLLKELEISDLAQHTYIVYFKEDEGLLYFFVTYVGKDADESYSILKYKIAA